MTAHLYQNLLAIDTSSLSLKLGLAFGNDRLVKSEEMMDKSHGQVIIKKINELFSSAGLKVEQLEAIIISTGPGSFTGLRIGLAVAKGMAVALDIPVVDINLFELAAYKLQQETQPVKVFVPFKKGEFFMTEIVGGKFSVEKIAVVTTVSFSEKAGTNAVAGVNINMAELFPEAKFLPLSGRIEFDAADLIYLGKSKLAENQRADLAKLEPLYLLKSQAEIKFEKLGKKE